MGNVSRCLIAVDHDDGSRHCAPPESRDGSIPLVTTPRLGPGA
jgi:hypothetical protein